MCMLNKKLINKRKQTMLKITKGGETINNNNEKVATITLEDCSVWNLTEYMYVDWDEFTETTHEELYECGWVQSYMLNDIHAVNYVLKS